MGGWTPDGHHVALSPPLSDDKPEKLVFVESRSGEQVKECPLDPLELLPFDEVRFRDLATDRWMIDRDGDPNMRWSGNWYQPLMSHWASALYDGPASTLTLSAFRPTFEFHLLVHSDGSVPRSHRQGPIVSAPPKIHPMSRYVSCAGHGSEYRSTTDTYLHRSPIALEGHCPTAPHVLSGAGISASDTGDMGLRCDRP